MYVILFLYWSPPPFIFLNTLRYTVPHPQVIQLEQHWQPLSSQVLSPRNAYDFLYLPWCTRQPRRIVEILGCIEGPWISPENVRMVGVDDPFLLKGALWAWVLGEQMLLVFMENYILGGLLNFFLGGGGSCWLWPWLTSTRHAETLIRSG